MTQVKLYKNPEEQKMNVRETGSRAIGKVVGTAFRF